MCIVGDRDEAFLGIGGELRLPVHEIAESSDILASHATAQLMQTRESELIWIDDDDRIGREEIHSILDDCRREEDIVFSFFEVMYPILDLLWWHLAMGDDYLRRVSQFDSFTVSQCLSCRLER